MPLDFNALGLQYAPRLQYALRPRCPWTSMPLDFNALGLGFMGELNYVTGVNTSVSFGNCLHSDSARPKPEQGRGDGRDADGLCYDRVVELQLT